MLLHYLVKTLMQENNRLTMKYKVVYRVTTYLRCGWVVNNRIKKGLLLSLSLNQFFFKSINIWQSYKQESGCLVHFLRLLTVWWQGAHSARNCKFYQKNLAPKKSVEIWQNYGHEFVASRFFGRPCIHRLKWRHMIYGHDTIAILWV